MSRPVAPPRSVPAGKELGHVPEGPPVAPRSAGLAPEALRKLQATLAELTECRRLLDAALQEQAEA
jgi:hypothetical protein